MVTPQHSEPANSPIVPLSEAELEAISGGLVNVSFTVMAAEESHEFSAQEFSGDGFSSLATSGQRRRSSFGLKFSGTFESMDHFSSFFSRFTSFFR
ncbi:MAG: hypothetical protein NW224_02505 [Leptolyngbyaceae cyanobacterium bins.302]|nr:hypothetical protein [Leptolyngbyaceae cyanobacterium bins.302]